MRTPSAPQPLVDNIAGYLQCMSSDAVAAAARGDIDVVALFRAELANRGLDLAGKWVGFEAARVGTWG